MFASIKLGRWRQFNKISIDLNRRMTVLTGENGTGMTCPHKGYHSLS